MSLSATQLNIAAKLRANGHPEAAEKFVSCGRKKFHKTFAGAMQFASRNAPHDGAYRPRIYKCRFCDGYHVTTKTAEELAKSVERREQNRIAYITDKDYAAMVSMRDTAIGELVKVRKENESLKAAARELCDEIHLIKQLTLRSWLKSKWRELRERKKA